MTLQHRFDLRLIYIAIASAVGAALIYIVAVLTPWGQSLDDRAISGWRISHPGLLSISAQLLGIVDTIVVVVACVAVAVIALYHSRDRWLAFAGVALVLGAIALTEMLKAVILTRPELTSDPLNTTTNSYPSGHVTVVAAIALALILIVPPRTRSIVLAGGVFATAVTCAAALFLRWHRPSDVVAACLVATAWAAVIATILNKKLRPSLVRAISKKVLLVLALLPIVLAFGSIAVIRHQEAAVDAVELTKGFWLATLIATATASFCLAAFRYALD